ncbi:hypothetical protein HRbin06_00876 [archaeon HR06]|nr:hypothetical protein HRbin06_00876 [archaeon HR06]
MLARLILTNETPVFLGGYNTNYSSEFSTEGLRTQSFKGLLRYWLRAYLAKGLKDLNKVEEEICRIVGGKKDKKLYASNIVIQSKLLDEKVSNKPVNYPRIKLLTLGGRRQPSYANLLKAEVIIKERLGSQLTQKDRALIIGSLLTGLLLSGLGKMNRRGLGTFSINMQEDVTNLFKDKVNLIFKENTNHEDKKKAIVKIIELTLNYLNKDERLTKIPEIHTIDKQYFKLLYIPINKNIGQVITDLQNFTMRAQRVKELKRIDEITKKHLAWFLGLPRVQKKATGYIPKDEVDRRASPLFIAVHKDFALISLFLSKDWPDELEWRGKGKSPLQLKLDPKGAFQVGYEAFQVVYNELKSYLDKKGYKSQVIYGE